MQKLRDLFDITKEIKLLTEIKDIRDELTIILRVLKDQQMVLTAMGKTLKGLAEELVPPGHRAELMYQHRHQMVDESIRDFEMMMVHANGAYDAVRDQRALSGATS